MPPKWRHAGSGNVLRNKKTYKLPKIIIIPDRIVETACRTAVEFANTCQSDFDFYLIPNTDNAQSLFTRPRLEVFDSEKYFSELKKAYNYDDLDLIIRFYSGILQASKFGLPARTVCSLLRILKKHVHCSRGFATRSHRIFITQNFIKHVPARADLQSVASCLPLS
jgi:hypothetical protein